MHEIRREGAPQAGGGGEGEEVVPVGGRAHPVLPPLTITQALLTAPHIGATAYCGAAAGCGAAKVVEAINAGYGDVVKLVGGWVATVDKVAVLRAKAASESAVVLDGAVELKKWEAGSGSRLRRGRWQGSGGAIVVAGSVGAGSP